MAQLAKKETSETLVRTTLEPAVIDHEPIIDNIVEDIASAIDNDNNSVYSDNSIRLSVSEIDTDFKHEKPKVSSSAAVMDGEY